jgi:hypothetical protein
VVAMRSSNIPPEAVQAGPGECVQINDPRPYVLTRDRLVSALQSPSVAGTLAMLEAEGGCPVDLADAILAALDAMGPDQVGED